jgi:hypothetical protein
MAKNVMCLFQIDFQVKYIFCVSKYTFCAHASKEQFERYCIRIPYDITIFIYCIKYKILN